MMNTFFRTNRKAKAFIILTSLCVLFIAVTFFSSGRDAEAETYNQKYFKCITIEEDATLWSIAEENMTEEYSSVNEYISEVKDINNLTSDEIYCGATLIIPYYAAPSL